MAKKKSPLGWIIGGIVLLLLLVCGGGAFLIIPKLVTGVGDAIKSEQAKAAFAASWRAPADDVGPDLLFPTSVAAFGLADDDEDASVPEFRIDLAGRHAVYESAAGAVQVFVYRASSLEKEGLYTRVLGAIEDEDFSMRFTSGAAEADRLDFSVSPPRQKGSLWWSQDWLFFFYVKGSSPDELAPFIEDYLTQIQPSAPAP